ncbi:hypothetical protein BTI63_04295 [Lactobacillus delbrueckii subsp. bulgaricus]|nr:hypothetical protein [Lactobacillus delbrueckii subsp. bulgaricus]
MNLSCAFLLECADFFDKGIIIGRRLTRATDANLPYYKEVTVRRSGMGWKVTVSDSIGQEESNYSVK